MRRDEQFTTGDRAHLEVSVAAGTIEVVAGSTGVVRVTIDAKDTEGFDVFQIGDTVTIREESRWRSRNQRVRVIVEAPTGFDLSVQAGSADITTRGRAGVVKTRTGSGDLDVDQAARIDAKSGSGSIRVDGVAGDAHISAASGDVTVGTAGGQFDASTASGDVSARRLAGAAEIGTASGDATVGRADGDAITIKTLSGDIRLGLPTGIRVEPDISTMSGKVALPTPASAPELEDRRTVRVRLSSMSGDIRIERAI